MVSCNAENSSGCATAIRHIRKEMISLLKLLFQFFFNILKQNFDRFTAMVQDSGAIALESADIK